MRPGCHLQPRRAGSSKLGAVLKDPIASLWLDLARAEREVQLFSFESFGDIAKIDVSRGKRVGIPEAVLAKGKSPEDPKKEGFCFLDLP